jgi:hypothetical protein
METKAMDLFDAFSQDKLPRDQGYIVSSSINGNTGYSIYEVISYSGVKAIYPDGNGLTFQSQGKKMHVLIEPASYPSKGTEPYLRSNTEQIPLRFKELDLITTKNQCKIMIAKQPIDSLSSFTVTKPSGYNISFVFYNLPDLYDTLSKFFEKAFSTDAGVPLSDAKKGAQKITDTIKKSMNFKGEYSGD